MATWVLMVIALFLAVASVGTSSEVSLDVGLGRLDTAVAALSKASGIHMAVAGPVASEVVYLHVNHLPTGEVMKSLARVTASDWIRNSDGSYRLERSLARTKLEFRKETDRKLAALNTWRAKLLESLQIPYDRSHLVKLVGERARLEALDGKDTLSDKQRKEAEDKIASLTFADPVCRALARTLRGIDLRSVATLAPQESVVFSTHPNHVQLPLPATASAALGNLQGEQAIWGKALKTKPLGKGEDADAKFMTDKTIEFFARTGGGGEFGARTEPWSRTLEYKKKPTMATLTADCYSEDAYKLTLRMFAADGSLVLEFEQGDLNTWPSDNATPETKLTATPNPKPSGDTLALWTRSKGRGDSVLAANRTLAPYFDNPLQNDPLRIGNQELLQAVTKSRKKSLIACLPDGVGFIFEDRLDVSDFLQRSDLTVSESNDLITIAPKNFAKHWGSRVDRAAIADCAKVYRSTGRIDLMSFVRLIASAKDAEDRSFGSIFIQLIDPDYRPSWASFQVPFQSAFVPLLASLTPSQFERLAKGQTIPYRELSDTQRVLASRIVYGPTVNGREEYDRTYNHRVSQLGPTSELPNGLLDGAGLSAKIGVGQVAVFHNGSSGDDSFYQYDLTNPREVDFWSGPAPRVPAGGISAITYTLHAQSYITLKCGLSPGHAILGEFTAPIGKATGKPVLISKLPTDVQKKLAKALDFLGSFGNSKAQNNHIPPR